MRRAQAGSRTPSTHSERRLITDPRALVVAIALGSAAPGCSRSTPGDARGGTSTAEHTSSGASAVTSGGDAGPAASAAHAPLAALAWSGTYEAQPGSLFVPDGGEWSGVKFRGDDASTGVGAGSLTFTVDPTSNRVTGTTDGAIGALHVTGLLREGLFSAELASSDPSAGFRGVAIGHESGGAITGTMRLSLPTGNVLREGTFTVHEKRDKN